MKEDHFSFNCLILIILFIVTLSFSNYAQASAPEIYSVIPNIGSNTVATQITIEGVHFQPSSLAALYGEGPYLAGSCDTGDAHDVYVKENYAYVADGYLGLQIIDINDPATPFIIGSCDTPNVALGVYVKENYAYVAAYGSGLQIIDITDPATPTIIASCDTPNYALGVYVKENYAYVADGYSGLQIIDISDPATPTIIASCDTPNRVHNVYVKENYAYVADQQSGLQIIDISTPAMPTIIGSCDTPNYAHDVYVKENYAYVADGVSGLQIIDISDPTTPTIIASCVTPNHAVGVYVNENYAYVANFDSGLQVIEKFKPLEEINYIDSGTIMATVPAGMRCGAYNLHIINPDGGHAISNNAFTIKIINKSRPSSNDSYYGYGWNTGWYTQGYQY